MVPFIMLPILLLGVLHSSIAAGSYPSNKVKIHVPHNIQHHHHTHTKYHFITLPLVPTNRTDTATQRPTIIMMPIIPGLNNSIPLQPGQPGAIPQAPNGQPAFPVQPQGPPVAGAGAAFQPPQPALPQQPIVPPTAFIPVPNAMYQNLDYRFVDVISRRNRDKPLQMDQTLPPMKFKTVINVQETHKIPLEELLNLGNLLKQDPPRRVKIDVYPEKAAYVKQNQKQIAEWKALRENMETKSYPSLKMDNLEYHPDYIGMESRQEHPTIKPEWKALKHLLERQIHEDFPGLKVQAEIKQLRTPTEPKERSDDLLTSQDPSGLPELELRHIGYIVVDNNNEQQFVAASAPAPSIT